MLVWPRSSLHDPSRLAAPCNGAQSAFSAWRVRLVTPPHPHTQLSFGLQLKGHFLRKPPRHTSGPPSPVAFISPLWHFLILSVSSAPAVIKQFFQVIICLTSISPTGLSMESHYRSSLERQNPSTWPTVPGTHQTLLKYLPKKETGHSK